ncbi:MAG: hydroxyisourate hydrolase [Gemmatimonadota bacterium]
MAGISTHVLDTATGLPAAGVAVRLEELVDDGSVITLHEESTDEDGRVSELLPGGRSLDAAIYRITFDTGAYFAARGIDAFYPYAAVVFRVSDPDRHHHVPLLLSPFGYSTYRGS